MHGHCVCGSSERFSTRSLLKRYPDSAILTWERLMLRERKEPKRKSIAMTLMHDVRQ